MGGRTAHRLGIESSKRHMHFLGLPKAQNASAEDSLGTLSKSESFVEAQGLHLRISKSPLRIAHVQRPYLDAQVCRTGFRVLK